MYSTLQDKNHVGTPDDEVFLKPASLFCHLCKEARGGKPVKRRKNLWSLYHHFRYEHDLEPVSDWMPVIDSYRLLIGKGVLKI